ncbi:MAG: hypothetical protein RLN90_11115 [Balneolaceae bacterium]
MKKITLSIALLLLLLSSIPVEAQFTRSRGTSVINEAGSSTVQIFKTEDVAGTPLYKDDFIRGKVVFNDNSTSETLLIDFDGFTQNIILKDGILYKLINLPEIKGFVFLDEDDKVNEFFSNGFDNPDLNITPATFLKVIYNGDVKLVAHFSVIYRPANFRRDVGTSLSSEYDSELTYYIINENGEFKKTRLRSKNLINDLGNYKKELNGYVKRSGFKGKTDKEAALILKYYETLKENS